MRKMLDKKKKLIIILVSVIVCLSIAISVAIQIIRNCESNIVIDDETSNDVTEFISDETFNNSTEDVETTEENESETDNDAENTTEIENSTEPENDESYLLDLGNYTLDKRKPLSHAPNVYVNWSGEELDTVYDVYYVEWRCTEDADETYWAVHNWEYGYAGFQSNLDGEKKILMSLWDLEDGVKPKVEYYAVDYDYGEFGHEGSGAYVFTPYNWKVGVWYSMKIEITYKFNKTYFTQFVREGNGKWEKTASISYPVHYEPQGATHVFQEDYGFNNERRSCELRNARGRIKETETWENWTTAEIQSSYIPYHDDTCWLENIDFNCDYEVKGNTLKIFSGGQMYKNYGKEFPKTVIVK